MHRGLNDFLSQCLLIIVFMTFYMPFTNSRAQNLAPLIPFELRGNAQYEREGLHDANNIRTMFFNFGMVGNYPDDPINVDLSIFHSVEVPKGSNENYSDGITPFVLARIVQQNGSVAYIMETGYRERQGNSPYFNRVMRFEPRPGYFQEDPSINQGRSVAMSNDPRTWPDQWIDKLEDPNDPGWSEAWNGYFGKRPGADLESFAVYDDQYYDAWLFFPDNRDATEDPLERRRGLGLRVEQRGFQWSNPQARNVIFWHYDITNESTTDYIDNIIFGIYMDSGVGGSAIGEDGIPESDDDNAYYDKEAGLNLVYTWDNYGHGAKGPTGYLGYSYMETPGNPFDGIDNDEDGVLDERRDGGPGILIQGQEAIRAYVESNFDIAKYENFYGKLENRPAYQQGLWWTGDEDMDWLVEFHDTGADGIFDTYDTGERDGIPSQGEPYFDKTDVDESDQIGLTGFKMNRIRPGQGTPTTQVDQIVFFDDGKEWPKRLYNRFTNPDSAFDTPLVLNYNIGFLFASGPFKLEKGKTERFSLALGWGKDYPELKRTTRVVQQIYKANYQFAEPPPLPTVKAYAGDGYVTLTWDDRSERAFDPVTNINDFEGYRIYRSTDPSFLDPKLVDPQSSQISGSYSLVNGQPVAQYDLINHIQDFSLTTVDGIAYYLGDNIGITHTFTDSMVTNGLLYYYAVCSYDRGSDSLEIYPSENAISVSQTLKGGTILPTNVVEVRPNPPVVGYIPANTSEVDQVEGRGTGEVKVNILNSELVPDNHTFEIQFYHPQDSVKATSYSLIDVTAGDTLFETGTDFEGNGKGPVGAGILPIIFTPATIEIDSINSDFIQRAQTNTNLTIRYSTALPISLTRPGFPEDLQIIFGDVNLDTSLAAVGLPAKPAKFKIIAKTSGGDQQLNFRFYDKNNSTTLDLTDEYIEVVTYASANPTAPRATWNITLDVSGIGNDPIIPGGEGDIYNLLLIYPYNDQDIFRFVTSGQYIDPQKAKNEYEKKPYVVPNPYLGAATFEPQRFAVSGRGERRIEFRNLPQNCTIRIFTITGELVQTLYHNGTITQGFIAWDLRSKDNLEIAPGLYIYHVESKDLGSFIGKFAIIK